MLATREWLWHCFFLFLNQFRIIDYSTVSNFNSAKFFSCYILFVLLNLTIQPSSYFSWHSYDGKNNSLSNSLFRVPYLINFFDVANFLSIICCLIEAEASVYIQIHYLASISHMSVFNFFLKDNLKHEISCCSISSEYEHWSAGTGGINLITALINGLFNAFRIHLIMLCRFISSLWMIFLSFFLNILWKPESFLSWTFSVKTNFP